MDLNETKLANAMGASELRVAREDEIEAIGAVPGYASPIGLPEKNDYMEVVTVVDDLIPHTANLVAGANEEGYHFLNTNYGRDYVAAIVADITSARDGDACIDCGSALHAVRGIEVGNIFKLGTRYSAAMGATFQNKDGVEEPVIMGSYGIGSGRLLASIVEEHHDEHGLIWPITVAQFHVHLIVLSGKKDGGLVLDTAELLYRDLQTAGVEVLFDDRADSPGVKFNDADLIGLPIRVTVGARSLKEGNIELKRRDQNDRLLIPIDEAIETIKVVMSDLKSEIMATVIEMPMKA